MKARLSLFGFVLFLAVTAPVSAQVRNVAELFPAESLAYLEVHQPARLAREASSLVKGSALEDMPTALARFRERNKDKGEFPWYQLSSVSMFGVFFGPEMLAEASRFDGAAVAVTGVNKDGPEVVAVLLNGTSNLPGMYLRAYITMGPGGGSAVDVEGVPVYRSQSYVFEPAPRAPGGPQTRASDPSYALLPGAVVVGTLDAVKGVVRRYKGKNADPGLTSVRLYKDLIARREQPGLYGFVDVGALAGQIDPALPANSPMASSWKAFKDFVNPEAVRSLGLAWTVQNGNLTLALRAAHDPKQTSPLMEMLPDGKADPGWLHGVSRDGLVSLGMPWSDGTARFERLIKRLDEVGRAAGSPDADLPSAQVVWLEEQLKISLAKDVFGKLNHVGLVVGSRGARPVLVCTSKDADAARANAELLPGVVSLLSRVRAEPTEEKVADRAVKTLPFPPSIWGEKLYYTRESDTVVLGFDVRDVAGAASGLAGKKGVLADSGYAESVKGAGSAAAVGTASLGQALVALTDAAERFAPQLMPRPPGAVPPPAKPVGDSEAVQEMAAAVEPLPPGLLVMTRTPGLFTLEFRQPELKKVSAKALNVWVDQSLQRTVQMYGRFNVAPGVRQVPPPP